MVTETYTIDPNSNRLGSVTDGGNTRLFAWDDAGNLVFDDRGAATDLGFFYNQRGRLETTVESGVPKVISLYNAKGERDLTLADGVIGHTLYDQGGGLIAEYNATSGTLIREYVSLDGGAGGMPLAVIEGGAVRWVHSDHLGTPQKMTDGTGAIVWDRQQRPYGESSAFSGSAINPSRFPGQYNSDATSGLYYNWHRYYDPSLGRYITSDPIGLSGGLNTYAYAGGNPVNATDPTGENPLLAAMAIGAATGALIDVGLQLYSNGGRLACLDPGRIGVAALAGGAFGGGGAALLRGLGLGRAALGGIKSGGKAATEVKTTLSSLHTRGTKIPGGRKLENTLAGSNKIKNTNGDTFKRVDFAPSKPHNGLSPHTHPNFRNQLPDGSIRSGVSRHASPVTRRDIIDASRQGRQRTGGL